LPSSSRAAAAAPLNRSRWAGVPAEERQAERRAQLIEAGLELLGTEGDAGTTVRAVCQRARLNPRYFYESFADRDALIVGVYDHVVAELAALTAAKVEAVGTDPVAGVRAGIDTIVRFVADDPRRAKVLYIEALGNEALNRRRIDTNHALVESLVVSSREQREPTPASERVAAVGAAVAVGGLSELILAWLEGRIDIELEQLVDDAVAMFLAIGETAARLGRTKGR
jgi:AcrR family transcriptional regulator